MIESGINQKSEDDRIYELRRILETQLESKLALDDVYEVGQSLIHFYETLAAEVEQPSTEIATLGT